MSVKLSNSEIINKLYPNKSKTTVLPNYDIHIKIQFTFLSAYVVLLFVDNFVPKLHSFLLLGQAACLLIIILTMAVINIYIYADLIKTYINNTEKFANEIDGPSTAEKDFIDGFSNWDEYELNKRLGDIAYAKNIIISKANIKALLGLTMSGFVALIGLFSAVSIIKIMNYTAISLGLGFTIGVLILSHYNIKILKLEYIFKSALLLKQAKPM